MGLAIDIAIEAGAWSDLGDVEAIVTRAGRAALDSSGQAIADGTELSVLLCDDATIRTLNRDWRGKDKATNVLSFPVEAQLRTHALGDIVVAWETCSREATEEGRSPADHLSHLVVHGLFHLLGFDHESEAEAEAMETLESRSLAALGIASPYDEQPLLEREDRRAAP